MYFGRRLSILANVYFSVYYEMPRSIHIHKSMLLRGVKFSPAVLDKSDKEATKNQASRSGRSFGGAPFRGNGRGNGRGGRGGGQINYGGDRNDRPNPFAAHMDPNFAPPQMSYGRGGSLPQGQYGAPPPRVNGHQNGQHTQSRGNYYGGQQPMPTYGGGYAQQPPPGGYYNGAPPTHNGYGNQYNNNGQYRGHGYGGR